MSKLRWLFATAIVVRFCVASGFGQSPQPPAATSHEKRRTLSTSAPQPEACTFVDLSFRYTGRGYHDKLFHYRLFVPVISSPAQRFPLIVWLHGYGDAGNDNSRQLKHLDTCIFQAHLHESFPVFLLAVPCPKENPTWTTSDSDADDMANVALAILDKTLHDYPIDVSRISVAGVSSGGTGCWDLVMRSPERFSAVAPMASAGGDQRLANHFVGLPVWAFHSADDTSTPVDGDRRMVDTINRLGGRAYLTEINSTQHDCWTAAFHDYDLLDWLLYQRRGKVSDYGPGTVPLKNRLGHLWDGCIGFVVWASSWGAMAGFAAVRRSDFIVFWDPKCH